MATIHTLIDYDRQNPTAISREQYTNVGADAFAPGTFPRAFNDLEVWDAATAGNQLVLDTDYELVDVDLELSSANYEDEAVYKTLRIINATYQVGSIWLTYSAIGTYPTALLHDPSELPASGALDGTEPITTIQSGEMVKATASEVAGAPQLITVKTASYVILDDNLNVYEFSGAGGDGTFTGPTLADNLGRILVIHNEDPTYAMIFDPEGGETVGGRTSLTLHTQGSVLVVRAGTSEWEILAYTGGKPVSNAKRIITKHIFDEDQELDYSASFTDGMAAATITFTELPTNIHGIWVFLYAADSGTSPGFAFKRSVGGTRAITIQGSFGDGGTNRVRLMQWLPTEGNTIRVTSVTADASREFVIFAYEIGE